MLKGLLMIFCLSVPAGAILANDHTGKDGAEAWNRLKSQPVTTGSFHAVCDLLQDIGKTNIDQSYGILAEYLPMVKATGNREWVHVLFMGWARAKESLDYFGEADSLYRQARENAVASGSSRFYDEALVGTVLLYAEWGKEDSLKKYAAITEEATHKAGDRENLSFIYTFRSLMYGNDTAAMGRSLNHAIELAAPLSDKNALFTARYNYALFYCQHDPQRQVVELGALLELARDPSLDHRQKLYERTAFCFRNPGPSIYYQLMQVNLLLTDYDNSGKFAQLFYDATVKPNPSGAQASYFDAEMAIVKAYQGEFDQARKFTEQSRALFRMPEEKIPYPSYFLAAGMLAEHANHYEQAVHDYELAYKIGSTEGLHLVPSGLYYAHGLILTHRLNEAERILTAFRQGLPVRTFSAFGYYYYKHYAELLKARGDYPGYGKALEMFYSIKDSLANLNQYRAIQEIGTRVRLRDKEQQITLLNEESAIRLRDNRRERSYFIVFLSLSGLIVLLLIGYARNLYLRRRQTEQIAGQKEILQQNKMNEMEKQHRIDIMQGAIDAEESERHKIADELHDEVGSMLSLATLNISSTLEKGMQDGQAEKKLQKAQEVLASVSTTVRDLSHRLTPLVIEKYGFRRAMEDMVDTINLSQKLKLELIITGFDDQREYPIAFLNDLYRIMQELLHNILKHALAAHAMLELVEHAGQVSILVEDDGVGIVDDPKMKGKGLSAIRSKIAYFNGQMEITGKKDKGTLVVIELPIDNKRTNEGFENPDRR